MEALDRAVWAALSGRQSKFALGDGPARRFDPDVEPFVACADDGAQSIAAVAGLLRDADDVVAFIQRGPIPLPPGTREVDRGIGVQMVATRFEPTPPPAGIVALGPSDVADMSALADLTRPGPFRPRTPELGQFWGFRGDDGRLLAMAGERMKIASMSEVSGVCTHPDARGRGYAETLSRHVASEVCRRGETPFLHAYADNAGAIRLYERLGFAVRCEVSILAVALTC